MSQDSNIHIPGYRILEPLGHGGMATVYLAIQESIDRKVAVKIMSSALAADPSFSERFVKEARMANLSHPNIITVYDAGSTNNINYIVMELAENGNLDQAIQHGIPVVRVVEVIKAIASALQYSCDKGFIHRDVKPENILFKEDNTPLLVDFGIAKAITAGTQLTQVGSTIGSPNYMSPEQARGLSLDGRADLYSLGIVFFEALTGKKPYDAEDTYVIGLKHISDPIPHLPAEFKKYQPIVNRLLAKSAEDRFLNGEALIHALDNLSFSDDDFQIHPVQSKNSVNAPTHLDLDEETRIDSYFAERETVIVQRQIDSAVNYDDTVTHIQINPDANITQANGNNRSSLTISIISVIVLVIAASVYFYFDNVEKKPTTKISKIESPEIISETVDKTISESRQPLDIEKIDNNKVEEKISVADSNQDTKDFSNPEPDSNEKIISGYLKKAEQLFNENKLTTPKHNSAKNYYEKVIVLSPNNIRAMQGLMDIADKYYQYASKKYNQTKFKKAMEYIEKGLSIVFDHNALLQLQEKIVARLGAIALEKQQAEKERTEDLLVNKTQVDTQNTEKQSLNFVVQPDNTVFSLKARSSGLSKNENRQLAVTSLLNKIYDLNLSQCYATKSMLETKECQTVFSQSLKQWPIALSKLELSSNGQFTEAKVFSLIEQSALQSEIDVLKRDIKDTASNASIVAIANLLNYLPIASLTNLDIPADIKQRWQQQIENTRELNPKVLSLKKLIESIKQRLIGKEVTLHPFVTAKSFEITPLASKIHLLLESELADSSTKNAEFQLRGEYRINGDGSISLDIWIIRYDGLVINTLHLLLAKSITELARAENIYFNQGDYPTKPIRRSKGFPAEVRIGNQTSNVLLSVNDQTRLEVKLEKHGFYFIAIHVKREFEEYSYLLPLKNAEIPFVEVAVSDQNDKFISLGRFSITPPEGIETIQLIASNVNLKRYLPKYAWSKKRQQFIIDGSEGNISRGIKAVRRAAGQLVNKAQDRNAQWQERLLITSIVNK